MKGLKIGAVLSFIISLAVLLLGGLFSVDKVPPYPDTIKAEGGILTDYKTIKHGQDIYQKFGLMDHGSVWGHGTLRGPDFSATSLHLTGSYMREFYSEKTGKKYESLSAEDRAMIDSRVIAEIKNNSYDAGSGTLTLSAGQEYAFKKIVAYWQNVFSAGDKTFGFLPETIKDAGEQKAIGSFFFWTAWAAGTNRPGTGSTYTNNWPPDRSVGNVLTAGAFLWSVFSILGLFVVLGLIIYIIHRFKFFYGEAKGVKLGEKLLELPLSSSQVKAAKFFIVVIGLFILQLLVGGLLAHYTIHPTTFYLDWIAKLVPYSWAKSWHLQLAIFWIATSWIGTAIYLAPVIGGKEPKGQGVLVNILFAAVVLVAVGSLAGEVISIKGRFTGGAWFWFGHQGWEFLELGRLWQILLFAGLIAWLVIVYRALKNRLYGPGRDDSGLVMFYTLSAILVVAFFGFGLFYGRGTHLTIADYWRWFVVHIWVESIFEFFGVAVIALFLVTLGLVEKKSAMRVAYLTAIIVFVSGIIGTAHHYFWYGGPGYWLALGSVFSSLEPIPLIMLVVRAWLEYSSIRHAGRDFAYKWPLFFLVASSFWNFLGAGVFGFLINLPVINYYEHATYLTSNHGHTALFGVYGMLSISLLLFTWRSLLKREWNDGIIKVAFWGLNIGLFLMFSATLLPIGITQVIDSYENGLWSARSADFYNRGIIQMLGQWRLVPDTIIIVAGALPLLYFLITTYFKIKKHSVNGGGEIYREPDRPV